MADALLSALVSTILGNLNSFALEELGIGGGLKTELQNLESSLSTIRGVLLDAEKKQWKSEAVKIWLRKLKDVAYDADDILDEFATASRLWKLNRGLKNKVRSFFSVENPLVFQVKMAHKVKEVREKLDTIASQKDKFHLREGVWDMEGDRLDWRQTSSLVNELEIFGRSTEKDELTTLLLKNSCDLSIYAIWGMGGLGKTTLAKIVYNDGRVESHFDMRIWVCASDDFDIRRLTSAILESIEGSRCDIENLDPLQRRLQEKLSGKKFLLVLDDVWNESHDKWNVLKDALRSGRKGSAVIVTTRIEKVAKMMATTYVHQLGRLSDDDSWALFEQRAFGMERREGDARLEEIGRAIVRKCGGVPLAIKAMGSLMRLKEEESDWLSVKESDIWDLPDEGSTILPALRLSYDNLRPHLKQCFAFCSIFPKDTVMEKDRLIEMWMANGFIFRRGQMDLHDLGLEIFNELVWRSFLQEVQEDIWGNTTCKMHDLLHDLAQSIMMEECCLFKPNMLLENPGRIRHLAASVRSLQTPSWYNELLKVPSLRSFVLLDGPFWSKTKSLHPYFSEQRHLRVLHLEYHCGIFKLPMSIGNLKQLRYLSFSNTHVRILPESLTNLQNLQILNLRRCLGLSELPKGMKYMKNLTYLDLRECRSLRSTPAGIGQLTCLRKLSIFIVGKDDGHHIDELKGLNLCGELIIKKLENVKTSTDARSANLTWKKNLQSLQLSWQENNGSDLPDNVEDILCGLQPHSNLKKLGISGYPGLTLPNWIMNLLLPNLVEVLLQNCDGCEHLPPFGKLQSLKHLCLRGMAAVKRIGSEVYGDGKDPFPSLETLKFKSMHGLEDWEMLGGRNIFPCLGKLSVIDCPRLAELPIIPSVKTLKVGKSVNLLRSVTHFTFISSFVLKDFPELKMLPDGLMQVLIHLERLKIDRFRSLLSLSDQLNNLSALKELILFRCPQLESLPEGLQNLSSLETIDIFSCGFVSFPINGLRGLTSLRRLWIQHCKNFSTLSEGVQYLTALEDLLINGCPKLHSFPESIGCLTALQSLEIVECEGLSSLPNEITHLTSLSCLRLCCPNLSSLPEGIRDLNKLRELEIASSSKLEKRCEKGVGEDWPKIAHISSIIINNQLVQSLAAEETA